MRRFFLLFFSLVAIVNAQDTRKITQGVPLITIYNLFIQAYAFEHVEWQRDLRTLTAEGVTPGRFIGIAPLCGKYTYRPASYHELSPIQQNAMKANPKLLPFIQQFAPRKMFIGSIKPITTIKPNTPRTQNTDTPANTSTLEADHMKYSYTLSDADMLSDKPLVLRLSNE